MTQPVTFMKHVVYVLVGLLILLACNRNTYKSTNKDYKKQVKAFAKVLRQYPVNDSLDTAPGWVGTTNFSMRRPNIVVIHHTAQNSCEETLRTFTLKRTEVSSHYVVCRDGSVHHMLNDYLRGHHAGVSKWGNLTDLNSSSIGIEVDNNGSEPFTEPQIASLIHLLGVLKANYRIPAENFVGHADIAPGRKVDPSRWFPWKQLADSGYGLWYDTTGLQVPAQFNDLQALRIIGYNVKDSIAAIQSFKIHFIPQDSLNIITPDDRKILYDLSRKYQ